jgi:CheY-like chemotaxis protein
MSENLSLDSRARTLVLVADDEATIRAIVSRVLVELGLVPVLVGDGAAAIHAVEAHGDELVCAILDVAMPGGNGIDAAHVIQRLAPDLPITLISGSVPNTAAGKITQLHLAGMLQKPFSLAALRALVLHAVDERAAYGKPLEAADNHSKSGADTSYSTLS